MGAPRGTTPTLYLKFKDPDLDLTDEGISHVYATIKDANTTTKLTKTGNDLIIKPKEVDVFLTQTETLGFPGRVKIQVNWTYPNGKRGASRVSVYDFSEQLEEVVLA